MRLELPTPCEDGPGERTRLGYVRKWVKGKRHLVHRLAYEAKYGPIPSGLELDHLCNNRWCRNPDHLEPKTHRENSQRRKNSKLSKPLADEIRRIWAAGGITQTALGARYGVSRIAVQKIVYGEWWI